MKKYKNLSINIAFCILLLIFIFILIGKVYSSYNPSESEFLSARASSLLRKIIGYGRRILEQT